MPRAFRSLGRTEVFRDRPYPLATTGVDDAEDWAVVVEPAHENRLPSSAAPVVTREG